MLKQRRPVVSSLNGKDSKDSAAHPFLKKDPKPTRARLVSLLDPLGRKRYSEVERFLATVQGATSGLFYYGINWGWAVRYLLGTKNTLCTLHLLRNQFEASVQLGKDMEIKLKAAVLDTELKRRLSRSWMSTTVPSAAMVSSKLATFDGVISSV